MIPSKSPGILLTVIIDTPKTFSNNKTSFLFHTRHQLYVLYAFMTFSNKHPGWKMGWKRNLEPWTIL